MNQVEWIPQEDILKNVLEVLQDSFVPDSRIQKDVQEKLNMLQNNPDLINYFLLIFENKERFDVNTRALAGLILKNNLAYLYESTPISVIESMKWKCLCLLLDPSKEVRASASALVNVIALKGGIENWPVLIPHLMELLETPNSDISDAALKALINICDDYLTQRYHIAMNLEDYIKKLLHKFVTLTHCEGNGVRKECFKIINEALQRFYNTIKDGFDSSAYLQSLIASANDTNEEIICLVCQGFVIYINNKDETILPLMHDIINYMKTKTADENEEIAVQACEFWLSLSKLPTCKNLLGNYLKELVPVLLNNMRYSDYEMAVLKRSIECDNQVDDRQEDIRPFSKATDDEDDPEIAWTIRKCSAASLDALAVQFQDSMTEIAMPLIKKFLETDNLLIRESGILAFGAIAEGCYNSLFKSLQDYILPLIGHLDDPHPLIRTITCWTLSRYFRFIVYNQHEDVYLIPVLFTLLRRALDVNKRVQRAAISAVCFLQEEAKGKIVPYTNEIVKTFLKGFEYYKIRSMYFLYDAIGALAQAIGREFKNVLDLLMKPILARFTTIDDYNNTEEFLAICECLISIISAVELDFLPYSEVVFQKSYQVVTNSVRNTAQGDYDDIDKDLLAGVLDLFVALANHLKDQFVKLLCDINIMDQMFYILHDNSIQVRQPGLALFGEIVQLCFPFLSEQIYMYIPVIIENLDKRFNGACNNAAWVIGKLCLAMGNKINPYAIQILEHLIEILQSTDGMQTMYKTVAIALCTLGLVCPDDVAPCLKNVMRPICYTIRNVADCEEKEIAFRGLCELVVRNPQVFVAEFIYFCDAVASWSDVNYNLKELICKLINTFQQHVGEDNWHKIYGNFPNALKSRLNALYGVKCPKHLLYPFIRLIIEEIRKAARKEPPLFGYNEIDHVYEPLQLMKAVIHKVNEICLRYLDNSMLCSLPSPGPPYNIISCYATRNSRRRMEDRHVVIHDLNVIFDHPEASPSSYYAIFDGHAGCDAAVYSAAHLHQYLAESNFYESNPQQAFMDAFLKTDMLFIDKCKVENFSSGTTAVCALLRPKEKCLYMAWVGDSQALIASRGVVRQIVNPHKPCREDERDRIEREGGVVTFWGAWRVNGQLAVSRAIGDPEYKPFVIAVPDFKEIQLNGNEDFFILACDGLWDVMNEQEAATIVYKMVVHNPEDTDSIAWELAHRSKKQGSSDNISVIVVFLREPSKIAADAHWASREITTTMDTSLDNANATNNPFALDGILAQKDGFMLNLEGYAPNNATADNFFTDRTNGKGCADEFNDNDDLGPETDVDAVDDVLLSPTKDDVPNNNAFELEERVAMEIDLNFQKLNVEHAETKIIRDETPTPPADDVHDAGLVENVGESGDESEDEWNYIKGETADKDSNSQDNQEVADIDNQSEDPDNMSQLNPDAAEFVPISPTRTMESAQCAALKDEEKVLSQSPRRGAPNYDMDLNIPKLKDFVKEVKNRPSEVTNGHENAQKLSSQEIMENFLNSKNIDDIEFQPIAGSPVKGSSATSDEFLFGPNATPFSTPGKFMDQSETSTKAAFGDDSTDNFMELASKEFEETTKSESNNPFGDQKDTPDFQAFNKEQDPMSMSFYQENEDGTNPFDLDKVQQLPENVEDFISGKDKSNMDNQLVTDLDNREHEELGVEKLPESPMPKEVALDHFDDDFIQKGDFMSQDSSQEQNVVKSTFESENMFTDFVKSKHDDLIESSVDDVQQIVEQHLIETKETLDEFTENQTAAVSKEEESPLSENVDILEEICKKPDTIPCQDLLNDPFESNSPLATESPIDAMPKVEMPILDIKTDYSPVVESCMSPKSESTQPEEDHQQMEVLESPLEDITSSMKDQPLSPEPEQGIVSPIEADLPTPQQFTLETEAHIDSMPKVEMPILDIKTDYSPVVESCMSPKSESTQPAEYQREIEVLESPLEDITSSVKDELLSPEQEIASPIEADLPTTQQFPIEFETPIIPVQAEFQQSDTQFTDHEQIASSPVVEAVSDQVVIPEIQQEAIPPPVAEEVKIIDEPKIVEQVAEAIKEVKEVISSPSVDKTSKPKAATPTSKKLAAKTTPAKSPLKASSATKTTTTAKAPLPTKPAASKPLTTTRTSATTAAKVPLKPKTTTTATKVAEKKPLTNGDLKPATKTTTTTLKKPLGATSTASKAPAAAKAPTSTTSAAAKRPLATSRPATAPAKTTTSTTRTTTATTSTTTKRPTSLTARTSGPKPSSTTSSTTGTKTAPSSARTSSTLKTSTTPPRPKPASAPLAKPRVPLTKTTAKAPDAEKQIKESVNKLTAARTTTTTRTTTLRKVEAKVPLSARTTTAAKTTTTLKSTTTTKRPIDGKVTATKTTTKTTTTKVSKPKENGVPNGVTTVTEITNVINTNETETPLIKDMSPIENLIDNSQLAETTLAD